ncbi:HD domain-containing protein [Desulfurococcus amylolyticus]|uniref:HD domain-containing protein n=1 Tax=Desulfurococcus amylolyticus TaxID=94694 RepID=UPI0012FEF1AF|nr:HD domain-containing protein [Desulfurococcus amylolyticus]
MNCDPIVPALILHDIGKLVRDYWYKRALRHEIIGAYVTRKVLDGIGVRTRARDILSLAVLLHHESIIIAHYVAAHGEKYFTVASLRKALEDADLTPICDVNSLVEEIAKQLESCSCDPNITSNVKKELPNLLRNLNLNKNDIFNVLKDLIVNATVGEPSKLRELRARVAAVTHAIVVSDSVAAYYGRSVCSNVSSGTGYNGGTWIVQRALEGAELLDDNNLRNNLCSSLRKC